ncbi:MAG TPA: tRNA (adenosine(37)-N6)-dimethylallyltransferase MiaA [Phycisphaerales bacterium]|nr:tRNA (adenosine(37)-N6)-dimethylallyltransferase MiaA [Phycisphaerales bacterium]HMP37749.1 tRNA (adenosine(37)-N6)-dimethylallyltransferase MiaA [Phycisphaerales bacterium]
MNPTPFPTIVLVGPTAGGKTRLAIELARRLPGGGVCIAADSMQVYRGMTIGTAKPTPDERSLAEHRLIDVAETEDDGFTVERWLRMARAAIDEIRAAQRWPIVVGGTNLYVKALLDGLFEGPPADEALRSALEPVSAADLRAELERVDPASAARIHPADRRRTIRAIEVHRLTGRPLSAHQVQWDRGRLGAAIGPALIVGLEWPVEAINRRINDRVRAMIDAGLVEEVAELHAAGRLGTQARAALGYAQIVDHLEGRCTLEEAIEATKIASRRYAKQQRTWLKRFRAVPGVPSRFFPGGEEPETLAEAAVEWILGARSEAEDAGAPVSAEPGEGAPERAEARGRAGESDGRAAASSNDG